MENIKALHRGEINKADQSSSIGLIIRQKEPICNTTPLGHHELTLYGIPPNDRPDPPMGDVYYPWI